jgi:PKD repeat protein
MWGKGRIAVILVLLVVVGGSGCLGGSPQNQSPVVGISANPSSGETPLTVTFSISASDPDGSISSWSLDVDDDGAAEYQESGDPPSSKQHTYNSPGTFLATLTVTDNKGAIATATQTIVVSASTANQLPVCTIVSASISGPLTVTFQLSASDPDGSIASWQFDADNDGTADSLGSGSPPASIQHTYGSPGTFMANFTVTDNQGGKGSDTITIDVTTSTNQAPNADFTYVVQGFAVYFTDASSDPDGDMVTYYWEFGDGTSSTLENPDHTYSDHGSYTVNLTVNDGELNDTTSKTVAVNEPVTGHLVINEVESNPPGTDAGYEWVELYNPTGAAIDVSGWKLQTTAGVVATYTIPGGTTIQAGGYLVITFPSQFLDNEQESVVLVDQSNAEIDRTPLLSDTANDAMTWQRIPNGIDTGGSSDWQFLSGTKGASNS